MKSDIYKFFTLQRQIFGVCHNCNEIFRLSDTELYLKGKPQNDWMDNLTSNEEKLDQMEQKLDEKQTEMRQEARKIGRDQAQKAIKKIDKIFAPKRINADDAKVLFHPIDYVVFDGLSKQDNVVSRVIFYDRIAKTDSHKKLQDNLRKVISDKKFDFITLKIDEMGSRKFKYSCCTLLIKSNWLSW